MKKFKEDAVYFDEKNVGLYGLNRAHYRSYKIWGSESVHTIETPIKDTLVPCMFACHINQGGIMKRSATACCAPRRGGFKVKKKRVTTKIVVHWIRHGLGDWIVNVCGAKLVVADCGSKIHGKLAKKVLKEEYNVEVFPRANLDKFKGGYCAYSPKTMPLDEIVFPNYQAKMSKFMKKYENSTLKSTMQYILFKECKIQWYSLENQDLCKKAVRHQEEVLRNILFPPEFFDV